MVLEPDGSDEQTEGALRTEEPPPSLILPPSAERELASSDESLGVLGKPFSRRAPFVVGFTGALGVFAAYALVRGIADVTSVLVVIGVALFIAVGLNPIAELLVGRGLRRGLATAIITIGFIGIVAAFLAAALPPTAHEIQVLVKNYPIYKADLAQGRGWAGKLAAQLHLQGYLKRPGSLHLSIAGGLLGAGKVLLSLGAATVSVVALTIYFLIALPGVRSLWLSIVPRSRRERVKLMTDETFERVGGFMLGNLLTSVVSGIGTFVWLLAFGVPYPLLLAIFVALFDLIPLIGSTIAGVVVALVALTRGFPIAIATGVFYVVYRFLEDYLLNPRVMKHTVQVGPGLTIIATLIGGSLLGLIGALIAIPVAATLHLLVEEVAIPRQNLR